MSEMMQGVVEEVINNGRAKGSKLVMGGLKYGVFDPAETGLDKISAGQFVSFRWKETEKGGITYKNIQGKITPLKEGEAVPTIAPTPTASAPRSSGYRKNGEEGGFPLHALSYERALDRRNAVNAAVAAGCKDVEEIISFAKEIEKYTTGDDLAEQLELMSFVESD